MHLGTVTWRALGTEVRLVITDQDRVEQARALLAADLAEVDAACSRFRPDSELCALRPGSNELSPLLAEAIAVALRAARLTDGDVDPAVGGAMIAAGYDRDFMRLAEPDDRAVPEPAITVQTLPTWQDIGLNDTTLTLPANTKLDLGATAKAWAADRSARRIAAALGADTGILVGLGGDVAVAGPAPRGGWPIRVQDVTGDPAVTPAGPYATITIHNGGLATSSTTSRRWRRGGNVLHHILDPRTGQPAAPVWRTVSVTAGSCADANAASTAAIVKGREAPAWLASHRLPARLVDTAGTIVTVAGWPSHPGTGAAA